jgi:hypothetical protein
MPIRLDTVLNKVEQLSNKVNSDLLKDFYQHMKDNGTSKLSERKPKGNDSLCRVYRPDNIVL